MKGIFAKTTIDVGDNVPCFVVSILPPHDYHLGFETRLRERLNKLMTDPLRHWTPTEMLVELRTCFKDKITPSEWLRQYAATSLILIP